MSGRQLQGWFLFMPPQLFATLLRRKLSLSTNQIDRMAPFSGMDHLRILSLARNSIKKIERLEVRDLEPRPPAFSPHHPASAAGCRRHARGAVGVVQPDRDARRAAGVLAPARALRWKQRGTPVVQSPPAPFTTRPIRCRRSRTGRSWTASPRCPSCRRSSLSATPSTRAWTARRPSCTCVGGAAGGRKGIPGAPPPSPQVLKRLPRLVKIDNEMVIDAEREAAARL